MTDKGRPVKILHMERLVNLFFDFDFDFDFESGEIYLDTSQYADASLYSTN